MRYIEWVSATLAAVDRVSRAHQASSFPVIAEALGIAPGEVTWEKATQAGTAGHALTIALSDLAALGYVDFEAVVNGARITQGGRDALGRGLTVAWAGWWDEAHLNPTSLGFLRRLAAFAEQPTQRWADVGWVDAGDIWREGGPPLEPEDLDEWQQVHDAVGDLHGKNLVEAKMYGRDSVNVRPTFKGMVRALDEHPMSAGRRAGILDWVGPRPGWEVVEQRLHALIAELADATDGDAYKNVGRRARDLFDDVAAMVFDRDMVPPGHEAPGPRDGKAMLDLYANSRLAGSTNKELRDFTKALDALANNLTHSASMGRVKAFASVQALVLLVRLLQEVDAAHQTTGVT